MPIEVENDPFFQLLTDALCAGPASPPWREAVAKLREGGGEGGDEFRLLIEARQNLEVGKSYREVRPGPEFTRKVLSGIDVEKQSGGGRRVPIAGIVTLLAGTVLIGVAVFVAHLIAGGVSRDGAVDDLGGTYFPTTVASANFNGPLPAEWRRLGGLKLDSSNGLRLAIGAKSAEGMLGGGVLLPQPFPADEPFAVEAHVRGVYSYTGDQLAEVFISMSPDFTPDRATAAHELVWLIRGYSLKVVLDGQVVAERSIIRNIQSFGVRMTMNKDVAIVELDHMRIWAGPHGLGDGPRYVGVRILTTAPGVVGKPDEPAIIDWKVLK